VRNNKIVHYNYIANNSFGILNMLYDLQWQDLCEWFPYYQNLPTSFYCLVI
jgi:hypothetical protein